MYTRRSIAACSIWFLWMVYLLITNMFTSHRYFGMFQLTLGHLGMFQICGFLWHLAPTPLVSQHSLWCSISTSTARVQTTLVHLFKTLEPLLQVSPVISCHVLPNRPNRPFGSSRSWHITPASKPEAHTN